MTFAYQVYASITLLILAYDLTVTAMSIERREMISRTITSSFGGIVSSSAWLSPNVANAVTITKNEDALFRSYQIIPDASANLNPSLKPILRPDLANTLAMVNSNKGGALWLGEHHNSATDHILQANLVKDIYQQRKKTGNNKMAVGLEMIQVQFQPALDAYISGKITADEMRRQVEWDKRWSWSFEGYLTVFETCRKLNIPLIALNVDSEDLGLIETGGFPAMPREKIQKYIIDPAGFAEFAKNRYYKAYVDYVISPSYDLHKEMGILRTTISGQQLKEDMPFSRFFSGRILWDEGMASNAYRWTKANPGGLMVGLVGADHAKFEGGITGRYKRMARDKYDCISVILNPTLIDTRPTGSVSMLTNYAASANGGVINEISLQLRYLKDGVEVGSPESRIPENTGGVLPLADYIVMSTV